MPDLLLQLTPLALAAALQPLQVIALVVILQSERGTANGLAYVGGMSAFRVVLALVMTVLVSSLEAVIESTGGNFDLVVGTVLVVLGLVMGGFALRRGLSPGGKDEDASLLDRLDAAGPAQAVLAGASFLALDPRDWLIDLAAIDLIAEADLIGTSSVLAYLFYLLLAQSLVLIPLIVSLLSPQRSQDMLGSFSSWMRRHERAIEVVVAAVFGLLILFAGLEYLGVT